MSINESCIYTLWVNSLETLNFSSDTSALIDYQETLFKIIFRISWTPIIRDGWIYSLCLITSFTTNIFDNFLPELNLVMFCRNKRFNFNVSNTYSSNKHKCIDQLNRWTYSLQIDLRLPHVKMNIKTLYDILW